MMKKIRLKKMFSSSSSFFKSLLFPKTKIINTTIKMTNIDNTAYQKIYHDQKQEILTSILSQNFVNLKQLRETCWGGVPKEFRGKCWRILLRTAGLTKSLYEDNIENKRIDYLERKNSVKVDSRIQHQIELDVIRIENDKKIFDGIDYSQMLVDILKVYAHERTVVSYVQGFSDILATFLIVFINEKNEVNDEILRNEIIESSSYFCFARLVDNIQDNYIDFQKSVFKMMKKFREIVEILEPNIIRHFLRINLEIYMFAFRWFNCCFMREFNTDNILVILDSMFSSSYIPYHDFMLFFGVTFLIYFKDLVLDKDFGECLIFLQDIKSNEMEMKTLQILLSKSSVNYNIFHSRDKT